jgi:hypothetical protein
VVPLSAVKDPTSSPTTANLRNFCGESASNAAPITDPISTTQRSHGSQLASRPNRMNDHTPVTAIIAANTPRTIVFERPRHSSRPEIATTAAMGGARATA